MDKTFRIVRRIHVTVWTQVAPGHWTSDREMWLQPGTVLTHRSGGDKQDMFTLPDGTEIGIDHRDAACVAEIA